MNSVAPLQRKTTQLTEHREAELVWAWSLQPYILFSLTQEGNLMAMEREVWVI